jgi:tetratricopeptide (TPR) repeat protein
MSTLAACVLLHACAHLQTQLVAQPGQNASNADQGVEESRRLLRVGDLLGAHRAICATVTANPSEVWLLKKRAQVLVMLDAHEPAMQDLDTYLGSFPADGEAWYVMGFCRGQLHRPAASLEALEESDRLGFASANRDGLLREMRVFVEQKRKELDVVRESAQPGSGDEYHWNRVVMEVELGLMQDAWKSWEAWSGARQGGGVVACARGMLLMEERKWSESHAVLVELAKEPPYFPGKRALIELAARQGDWNGVLERTGEYLATMPDDWQVLRLRAIGLLVAGDHVRYRECAKMASLAKQDSVRR